MKKKLLLILLMAMPVWAQTPSTMRSTTTLPATCNDGSTGTPMDIISLVTAGISTPYYCKTTNNWVASVGTSISLQTNGVINTLQGTLNIKSGTNSTATSDGAGGVTVASFGDIAKNGVLTAGHLVKVFDATHIADLNVTGTGLGVLQTDSFLLGTTDIAILKLSGILTLTQCLHVNTLGIVSGTGSDCGSGGGGSVFGSDKQLFVNNAGVGAGSGVLAGSSITTQTTYNTTTGRLNTPNQENIRHVDSTYQWSQSPAANLSGTGAQTITLTPCPLGIDVSNNANSPYAVYIATTGTPEVAVVTGGSCTSGGTTGTITLTTVNTHSAGYTVASSTDGVQEAINDAGSPNANVVVPPCTGSSTCYNIRSTVYLKSNRMAISAYGAHFSCLTRGPCFFMGDRSFALANTKLLGARFAAGVNVDGIQITNTVSTTGAYTVTTNGTHSFVTGDYVFVDWYQANGAQHAIAQVTGTTSTTFTYSLGSATVATASAVGWAALEAAAIEDGGEGSVIRDTEFTSVGSPSKFHFAIVVDNDQAAIIDHISNESSGNVIRCTANFCGAAVLGRVDAGAAPVIFLKNSDLSMQCGGNGVLDYAGNGLSISDTIIQGTAQFGIYYEAGNQPAKVNNVYEEVGACNNPFYSGSVRSNAGIIVRGQKMMVSGSLPIVGEIPLFAASSFGVLRRNYYIVPRSATIGYGPIMLAGYCLTTGSGTCTVQWPQIPNNSTGAITYDILESDATVAPQNGNAFSVALNQAGTCSNSVCSFVDTIAATTAYTIVGQLWSPNLRFWPGSAVVGLSTTNSANSAATNASIVADSLQTTPLSGFISSRGSQGLSFIIQQCGNFLQASWSPLLVSCGQGESYGSVFASLLQQKDPANNAPTAGIKGRLNLGGALTAPIHLITLSDTDPSKTASVPSGRPAADTNDVYVGVDQGNKVAANMGLSFGAPLSITEYIANTGDNASWLERLTASAKTVKVPLTVNDGTGSTKMKGPFAACGASGSSSLDLLCFDQNADLSFNKANAAINRLVIPKDYTFSSGTGFPALPAANAVDTGQLAVITDASTTSCPVASGGGSNRMLVRSNGTTWDCVGGSGGGSSISVSLFSGLPVAPANNTLAIVTDFSGSCPVTAGSGSAGHNRLVKYNTGTVAWDCVPDGSLPNLTTTQIWDGTGNGGIHFLASSTDTNTGDQNSLHTNSLGTHLIFADSGAAPATQYRLGMWDATLALPLGATRCLIADSALHIAFAASTCFSNPLTTQGDLMTVNSGGVSVRLPIGANGTVPTSNGTSLSYQAVLTNPMTTPGDLIVATTAGAPIRVGIGSTGQVWTVVGGTAAWATATSGGTVASGLICNPAYYAAAGTTVSGFTSLCFGDGATTAWMKLNPTSASQDIFNVSLNSANKLWVDSTGATHVGGGSLQLNGGTVVSGQGQSANVDYSAGLDANSNQTGTATYRCGDVTGNSSTSACQTIVRGGNVNGTGATASANDVTIQPGALINAAPGASATEGKLHILNAYLKGGTTTIGNLACVSSSFTVSDCVLGSNARAVGFIQGTSGGTVYVQKVGRLTINLDASSTFSANDRFCTSTTGAAQIHANGTSQCPSSTAIAGFAAASGSSVSTVDLDIGSSAGGCSDCLVTSGVSDVLNRQTSQGAVTVATAPTAGLYNLKYYADLNTACTTGGNAVSFTFSWTDASGARSLTTGTLSMSQGALTASSYITGIIPLWIASGDSTYTSTVSGSCASGASSYDIHVSLVKG